MANPKRVFRLNSLLREVISEVIRKDVNNPHISEFTSVVSVDITPDLRFAKVLISIIGTDEEKKETITALNQAAGFIGVNSAKKVTMRYFPTLSFELDLTVEKQMKIDKILTDIKKEKEKRSNPKDE
ncbi:MAG: Ribosome-binding factor A [Candidatus Anoxychlamydiales bacterium]|nr:Ribosome-binding factor A [Candidatus Anoxychlamydiales bacterium]NGX35268.1 Ribosome-binding factor A [Candidatus Anoxychlamydiales bacterium]